MSVIRRIKRGMVRTVAKQGAAAVLAKVDGVSRETEKTMLAEQQEHAREISALMMAVPTRVLVRDMGYKPLEGIPEDDRRKIKKFAIALMAEIEKVNADEKFSIDRYVEEVYEETGVSYRYNGDAD